MPHDDYTAEDEKFEFLMPTAPTISTFIRTLISDGLICSSICKEEETIYQGGSVPHVHTVHIYPSLNSEVNTFAWVSATTNQELGIHPAMHITIIN